MTIVYIITYGFDYEHVHYFGAWSSLKKAKDAVEKCKELYDGYDYYNIDSFKIDEEYK